MKQSKPYSIIVLLNATPLWLSLTRKERSVFFEQTILPINKRVEASVDIRFFDSEYFHASVSDYIIITTGDLESYKRWIELIRDTKIYGEPFFKVKDIIIGQEMLFEDFNREFNELKK